MQKEEIILNQLIFNADFSNFVLQYLQPEYFQNNYHRLVFESIRDYIEKYKQAPSKEALFIVLKQNVLSWDDDAKKSLIALVEDRVFVEQTQQSQWLLDMTEEFCRTQAIYNGLVKSIEIHSGNTKESLDSIPSILQDALNICFDTKIGLDYLDSLEERYLFYTSAESGIPFDIPLLNQITNKIGLPRKGLTVLMSETHAGKTLCKCHIAASAMKQGFNVLYISLEISKEQIAQRIDANLLDIEMDEILNLSEDDYIKKMQKVKKFCKGKLIIEEFPTASGHAGHFRRLIEDLKKKKGFIVDLLVVDYINICSSMKYKAGMGGTYTPVKSIAEELRALGMEYNCAVLSSAQSNRGGFGNQDRGLEAVAESMGIAHTADVFWSLFRNEQLDELNRMMIIQLKNRLKDLSTHKRVTIGVERPKMKLFPVQDSYVEEYISQEEKKPDKNNKKQFNNFQF